MKRYDLCITFDPSIPVVIINYCAPQVIKEYLSSKDELPTDLPAKIQWRAPDIRKFQACS
jgi:hypothetical protein